MKTLTVALTVNVEITVPDDSPVTAEKFASIFDWKVNDHTDGRHPFSTEMIFNGVRDACNLTIQDVLFHHFHDKYRDWIQGPGTSERRAAVGFKVRDKRIEEALRPIMIGHPHRIEMTVEPVSIDGAIRSALVARDWQIDTEAKENAQGELACFIHPDWQVERRFAWLDAVLAQQEREVTREEDR